MHSTNARRLAGRHVATSLTVFMLLCARAGIFSDKCKQEYSECSRVSLSFLIDLNDVSLLSLQYRVHISALNTLEQMIQSDLCAILNAQYSHRIKGFIYALVSTTKKATKKPCTDVGEIVRDGIIS